MALYLGKQKVSAKVGVRFTPKDSLHYATGTIMSDDNGVITFPELGFTPKIITIWNVSQRDLAEEWEEANPDEDYPEDYCQYSFEGTMLMAVNIDGTWISQGLSDDSGSVAITNASWNGVNHTSNSPATGITFNDGIYSYYLNRHYTEDFAGKENTYFDITNTRFNYAIYGE